MGPTTNTNGFHLRQCLSVFTCSVPVQIYISEIQIKYGNTIENLVTVDKEVMTCILTVYIRDTVFQCMCSHLDATSYGV